MSTDQIHKEQKMFDDTFRSGSGECPLNNKQYFAVHNFILTSNTRVREAALREVLKLVEGGIYPSCLKHDSSFDGRCEYCHIKNERDDTTYKIISEIESKIEGMIKDK